MFIIIFSFDYVFLQLFIGSFDTTFLVRITNIAADGFAFVIQNSPNGTSALGDKGGNLGYFSSPPLLVTPSFAVGFDTFGGESPGGNIKLKTGRNASVTLGSTTSVLNTILGCPNCSSGADWNFAVSIRYSDALLSYTITNVATMKNYSRSELVDIPGVLGSNFAWVGFSGGTGGLSQTCEVIAWSLSVPTVSPSFTPSTAGPSTISPVTTGPTSKSPSTSGPITLGPATASPPTAAAPTTASPSSKYLARSFRMNNF
jgi:hypothetical protein